MRRRSTTTSRRVRDFSAAESTSSKTTARPSSSNRPKPRRRSVSIVSATGSNDLSAVAVSASLLGLGLVGDKAARSIGDDRNLEPDQEPGACRQLAQPAGDDLRRLADHFLAALTAVGPPDAGEQQPHVVVDFRRGADR